MVAATKIPDTAPKTTERFERLALDAIDPDMAQPRKTFDETELAELAVSIEAHGVVVPIKVRPHPSNKPGRYLLVDGERRWRASKLAKKSDIPAVIEDLDATEALEQQVIANSQRVDVPPLEEAEAYETLMKKHAYTMEKLIAKTGRSKAHLYGRLKLLGLAPGAKKALQAGKLQPAIAELVARIPDQKLQEQATKDVLGQGGRDAYSWQTVEPEKIANDEHGTNAQPLSFRAALQLIRRRYHTQFDLRRFDPSDKTLVPKAGACTQCPHRAGNQPGLPGIAPAKGVDDDHCTNPPCFEDKVEAHFNEKAKIAQSQGLKVIDGAAAKKILPYHSGEVAYDANYVDPKDKLPSNIAKPGSTASFGSLLGKKLEEVPRVFVQDPSTGIGRELLVKDKAIEKLKELGKIEKPAKKPSTKADDTWKKQNERDQKKKELNEAAVVRVLEKVAEKATEEPNDQKELAWSRWIARAVIVDYASNGGDDAQVVLDRRGLENYDVLEQLVVKAKTLGEVRGILVEFLVCLHAQGKIRSWVDKRHHVMFDEALKLFGADWDKALASAKDAAKAEDKVDAAKDAKKPAKKGKGK